MAADKLKSIPGTFGVVDQTLASKGLATKKKPRTEMMVMKIFMRT